MGTISPSDEITTLLQEAYKRYYTSVTFHHCVDTAYAIVNQETINKSPYKKDSKLVACIAIVLYENATKRRNNNDN